MPDDEDFGVISEKTKMGIITLVDSKYNYVWNTDFHNCELRYPLNPDVEFEVKLV